jgi:hypothetical protein
MQNQPAITVFVILEYWEIYWANIALLLRMFRITLFVGAFVGVLGLAIFIFERFHAQPAEDRNLTTPDWLWLAVLWVMLASFFVSPLFTARRAVADERVRKGTRYRFSDAGIHIDSPVATADVQWAGYRYVVLTRSLFLLLMTNRTAAGLLILPIRCLASDSDLAAFRQLLNDKIPKAKLRLY